jgi:hypothetical protein
MIFKCSVIFFHPAGCFVQVPVLQELVPVVPALAAVAAVDFALPVVAVAGFVSPVVAVADFVLVVVCSALLVVVVCTALFVALAVARPVAQRGLHPIHKGAFRYAALAVMVVPSR